MLLTQRTGSLTYLVSRDGLVRGIFSQSEALLLGKVAKVWICSQSEHRSRRGDRNRFDPFYSIDNGLTVYYYVAW